MKSRKAKRQQARPLLPYLANERGMMLVLTMVILLVLSSMAASNLINAYLERSIARNQHYSTISLNAAEAGLALGLTKLNTDLLNGNTGAGSFNPPGNPSDADWNAWATPAGTGVSSTGDVGEGSYTVRAKFLLEDLDGDGACEAGDDRDSDGTDCEVVYYNAHGNPAVGECGPGVDNCFGWPNALFRTPPPGPFPVVQITSVGTYGGASTRTLTLEVARNPLDIQAYGAITASSNINLIGNVAVDGGAHDENGNPCATCSCNDAYPGVTVSLGHDTTCGGSCSNDGIPGPTDNNNTYGVPPLTPDAALGLPEGSLVGMVGTPPVGDNTSPATSPDGSIKWIDADIQMTASTDDSYKTGVLIVHNPLFDSATWNLSDQGSPSYVYRDPATGAPDEALAAADCAAGTFPPGYDGQLDDFDPCGRLGWPSLYDSDYRDDREPRNLSQSGNVVFKGVIIADQVQQINGTFDIYGAVISLNTVDVNINSNGAARIFYSCDAINLYTAQSFSSKLSWHRRF